MIEFPTPEEIKAKIEAMTPEERKALVNALCAGVNDLAVAVVENADEIWESNKGSAPTLH